MPIWNTDIDLVVLNEANADNMAGFLGIEFIEIGDDFLIAKMPVDHRTKQPLGRLHGGASVVLAETVGSMASSIVLAEKGKNQMGFGLTINANHVRGVSAGFVFGKATNLHLGRTTHLWAIEITNEEGKLVCASRLTVAVVGI